MRGFIQLHPNRTACNRCGVTGRLRTAHRPGPGCRQETWFNWAAYLSNNHRYIGLFEATVMPDNTIKLAYTVFKDYWRQGLAAEACRKVIEGLQERFPTASFVIEIDSRNTASIALAATLGFTLAETVKDADYFKGNTSDELVFTKPGLLQA